MYDKYMCILYAWITLINLLEEKHEYYGSCKINLGQLVSTDKMNHIQFGLHGRICRGCLFYARLDTAKLKFLTSQLHY